MHTTQLVDLLALDHISGTVTVEDCRRILTLPEGGWAYLMRDIAPCRVEITTLHTPAAYYVTDKYVADYGGDIVICPTLDQVAEALLTWQV